MSKLSAKDIEYVRGRYQKRIAESGVNFKSMNSGTQEKQTIRHGVHGAIIKPNYSVLDVGSGIGQFYEHLVAHKYAGKYTGLDIVPEYVAFCQKQFSKATFRLENFFESKSTAKYDVVVASQVFNAKYPEGNNEEVLFNFLKLAFEQCDVGVSVDLMTSYVDFSAPELYYFNPENIFKKAKELTRLVALRHDYLPFEFTVQLFKQ